MKFINLYIAFSLGSIMIIVLGTSCSFRSINRSKGIEFFKADSSKNIAAQKLNVFSRKKKDSTKNVLIFIHGGNWNSGKRSLYNFFGTRMARKGITTVVIDYPLSPKATYKEMTLVAAASIKWVQENIARYGGDPERIFVSGHSAGGHLAALVSLDHEYFDSLRIKNPIIGTILIDAAGLDMYSYLKQEGFYEDHPYLQTFTADPAQWKKASPVYYLKNPMPAFLVYQGGKTYASIKESNETFMSKLLPLEPATQFHLLKGKKHVAMITQFFKTWNPRYREIGAFMTSVK